jgi:NADH-quinone oxidoreductase subunit N
MTAQDIAALLPLWIPALGFLLILTVETIVPDRQSPFPFWLSIATVASGLFACWRSPAAAPDLLGGRIALDGFGLDFCALLYAITLGVLLSCAPYVRELRVRGSELYALLLASLCGMLITVTARDLLLLFLGIELLSIPLYILAGYRRLSIASAESAFKYFLFGAFASGFLVYGMALLYGAAGSTRYLELGIGNGDPALMTRLGVALLTVGLAFKVAAAPFHSWAPDVYQGAPTPITAFMAAGVKAAAFGAVLRLALEVFPKDAALTTAISVLAVGSMLVGNLGALLQTNLKRMIAYSSIAHAGYLLVGIAAVLEGASEHGSTAVRFYLVTYALMTLGAFSILLHFLRSHHEGEDLRTLHGLSRSRPYLSFALALCFLSLAGIPFTAGFFGKLYLLRAALEADLVGVSIVLIVTSILSLYYYLRVVSALYMKPASTPTATYPAPSLAVVSIACAVGILIVGLYPQPLLDWLG